MLLVSHGIIKRLISMKTGISLVLESDIGVAADLDGPIQALLENAVAQPVHLGEIVDEFPEFSHPAKGPSGPAKNALHAGVGHSDYFDQFNGKAEFNHARKQLVTGSSKSAARLRRIRGNIERESAAPQIRSLRGAGWRPAGSGRCPPAWLDRSKAKAGRNLEYVRLPSGSVDPPLKDVKLVDFHVLRRDELHHFCLPASFRQLSRRPRQAHPVQFHRCLWKAGVSFSRFCVGQPHDRLTKRADTSFARALSR